SSGNDDLLPRTVLHPTHAARPAAVTLPARQRETARRGTGAEPGRPHRTARFELARELDPAPCAGEPSSSLDVGRGRGGRLRAFLAGLFDDAVRILPLHRRGAAGG